jgi:hypothetical protein
LVKKISSLQLLLQASVPPNLIAIGILSQILSFLGSSNRSYYCIPNLLDLHFIPMLMIIHLSENDVLELVQPLTNIWHKVSKV